MCKRNKKHYADDDGRTIADMNIDGFRWYNPNRGKKVNDEDKPTKKERRAMIKASYLAHLPQFICLLLGLGGAILLIYLWLHGWSF